MIEAADIFPIYKVEHDCIQSMQGDLTVVFRLMLPEIFTLSERDYESYHQAWVKAIRVLPVGTVLHKQDWFLESRFNGYFSKSGHSIRV